MCKKQLVKQIGLGCLFSICFFILNYCFVYLVARPVIQFVSSSIQVLLLSEAPNFEQTFSTGNIKTTFKDQAEINSSQIQFPKYGEHYGEISIPTLKLKVPLYFGDSESILRKGAGQYMGSVFPGEIGTTLIGGHNIDSFGKLLNIQPNEQIDIQTTYGSYHYTVTDKKVANKADWQIAKELRQQKNRELILYTCYPIDSLGLTNERLFITANLISGPKINENN
ncbi:class D sortase [Enterococcus hirae]|uniref:class D sortase n=1 Tax=Enterococcus hirae TaxID=1354 RepID=UPI0027422F70|nr:class D sortase [Enterococcus hirae]MDU4270677.1 class D sortase [Enterococcus hirae]